MTIDVTRLNAPLDANRVKSRDSGRGQQLSYLETHDVIRTANDIFGFGAWGHEIIELRPLKPVTITNREGKTGLQVGYLCVVRLTVHGCVPVSGVGYGDAVEYRASAPVTAHELAAKEAESDALKRALKNYGDQFGLVLYDKQAATNGHLAPKPSDPTTSSSPSPLVPPLPNDLDGWRWQSGKNQGKTLAETDRDYIEWYAQNGPKADVKLICRAFLDQPVGDEGIPF